MNRRMLALAAAPVLILALAGCDRTPGPAPTVGQTSYAPGNEDACVWTGDRWVEADDGEDCGADIDSHHGSAKRTVTVAPATRRPVVQPAATRGPAKTVRKVKR